MSQRKSRFLSVLLLLGASAFLALYLFWPAPKEVPRRITASSPKAQALINKHLWLTSQAQELAQRKREFENAYNTLHVGDSIWPKASQQKKELGVDHSPDSNETNAYEDLHRYTKEINATNPDHVIQNQITEQEAQKQYAEEYRAEYARQFIENARRSGYKVELNSDYVVISVSKIPGSSDRNPSATDNFSGPQAK